MEVIAPARVCLYGEHQDYLELKVIPSAINLYLSIRILKENQKSIYVTSENINKTVNIPTNITNITKSALKSMKQYLEAGLIAVNQQFGIENISGFMANIKSSIPLASGLSSSAALLVAWIKLLTYKLNISVTPYQLAELAYHAEHDILGIPCGRMDQYAIALGKVFSMDCSIPPVITPVKSPNGRIIVVNSLIEKLTNNVHSKKAVELKNIVRKYEKLTKNKISAATYDTIDAVKNYFSRSEFKRLSGIVSIKEYTRTAEEELLKSAFDILKLGELLTKQQHVLSKQIEVSTPLLDKIVEKGIKFGALGGKLTGAGFGGCVILLVEENLAEKIASKLKNSLKLPVWITSISEGVKVN
ncbi:MAG: GHMP family kinase ATP-binding protein [Candidatus Heimdallarchaeaceae archaeon]